MQFFKKTNWNFLGHRKLAVTISVILLAVTIVSFFTPGMNMSIDFAGGTVVQMKFQEPVVDDIARVRSIVDDLGFGQAEIRTIGPVANNEAQITVKEQAEDGTEVADAITAALQAEYSENPFEVRSRENVGPRIGSELRRDTIIATVLALLAILIYVGIRFNLPFGVAAVVPLFHDVLITLGIFALLQIEISLPVFAALLTIVGYSLNDTIVIFDRIRENMKTSQRGKSFIDLINTSINQTISRTVITSLTTFVVVTSLYIVGSDAIKDFALALMIGVVAGTYSTLYVASPILLWWNKKWAIARK
ncbi:protein translocase subunit SecF [Chitinispirillales bacterium ANBcel5]|uniref:protein translocase subunit SecF n=1 Tax=Cellulosispirillum alkaliphilum TaxID=3039283 RepID=UPI002A54BDE7|nr:protein translocase subunit SecF [Chitinispirillales bacterium ANBcel5]